MLSGSIALVDGRGAQVDRRMAGGPLVTKELSVVMVRLAEAWCWADEDVGAIG